MIQLGIRRQRSFNAPPVIVDARVEGLNGDPSVGSPICQRHRSSVVRNCLSVATISALFSRSRPSAVLWAIVAVIVNAVYGVSSAGPFAEIGYEVLEASSPPLAHFDSTTTVSGEGCTIHIFASLNHTRPDRVFSGPRTSVGGSMFFGSCSCPLSLKAPATRNGSVNERTGGGDSFFSAIANARPIRIAATNADRPVGFSSNEEATESLAAVIDASLGSHAHSVAQETGKIKET